MNNPYSKPTAHTASEPVAEALPKRFGPLFWLIAGAAGFFSFLFGMAGLFIVPAFEQVYRSFGADLPWGTDLVLATSKLWWLLTAVVAALWCYSLWAPRRLHYRSRLLFTFAVLAVGTNVAIVLALVALYSPIFALGKPV